MLFKGSGTAVITPFNDDLSVNYKKLAELIEYQIQNKTDAIIICGTTGETPAMDFDEQKEVIKFAVEVVNGRVPVIAGTGTNNTMHALDMSMYAEKVGVDGILVVNPYYNKSTQKGIYEHFKLINDNVNIPIIVYIIPGRTGINITPATVERLITLKNIKGIKEASGNISQVVEIARIIPEGFHLYSGNDDMIVPLLSVGGSGVISVVSNIMPVETHDMVMSYLNGDVKKSSDLQLKMKPLIDALFIETNPIPIKTAMNLMGQEVGPLRMPLVDMDDSNKEVLINELQKFGLL